jgi:hypothetical protein
MLEQRHPDGLPSERGGNHKSKGFDAIKGSVAVGGPVSVILRRVVDFSLLDEPMLIL